MKCQNCKFYKSGYMYNSCALTVSEYFREPSVCDIIDDNYIFTEDCEPMGFIKGENALEYLGKYYRED